MARPIKGFNYVTDKPEEHSLSDWREIMEGVLKKGGRRRVEIGETFLHGKDGILQYEIYGNVAPKKGVEEAVE